MGVGLLEARQHVGAELQGLVGRLEGEGVLLHPFDPVVAGHRAGGEHQGVERDRVALSGQHRSGRPVDPHHVGQAHHHVVLVLEDGLQRAGDGSGLEHGRGHLVEQGLEEVEVADRRG